MRLTATTSTASPCAPRNSHEATKVHTDSLDESGRGCAIRQRAVAAMRAIRIAQAPNAVDDWPYRPCMTASHPPQDPSPGESSGTPDVSAAGSPPIAPTTV